MPEARQRGFKPGRFSFNVKGGRCEACQGDGVIAIEMHFLPNVYVTCEQCKGRRYNRETLDITYRGKSIADVLELTVDQALPLLENFPAIANKLRTLQDVGLGYVALGQSATTLSGGEAQRVKLAKELSRRGTGSTLYILDEPTTGLHFEDTRKLLDVLSRLVDQGNTVVVIEHNLDVVRTADHVIDLGPEGGAGGGRIVADGTPEAVARHEGSATGRYLAELFSQEHGRSVRSEAV
jgi:excinuclease ABC subunit A